ncbi:sacsin N-terminal ATP-binding-like domain-containing protein [Mucilaginibacter aquariorum]|uniref:ATP-binding protein n=1 Tax=Mucilaginibacter aquariorum TaxID=2967225 RepID=A0ABT1T649_9SPHI|nr:hypothetical protein [Mucilaginibacter aquariorum]MCQ6960108.1 hypothetical protein [Mucilaginibacter aquariorum]
MIQSIEEGRKEDGNRSIADKIIKRLHDLEMTVQTNFGRWAWELLQNAKDSVADTKRHVSVQIIFDKSKIEFRHNGNHFTEKDIRGLINQISSKEVEEGEVSTRTGKFGTGFLTTHLLSKVVTIKGIIETKEGRFFKFNFPLDRDGKSTTVLIPKIENAWRQFHLSTENGEIDEYDAESFNTSFSYDLLTSEQKEIAKTGVDEFIKLIPYVLTFIPEINTVEIIDNTRKVNTKFKVKPKTADGFKVIAKTENGTDTVIRLLYATNGTVTIAVRVKKVDDKFEVLSLDKIPKLFCDFPLIGTENFYFPIVVNSFHFNPQTERDGIWLMGDTNAEVLENKDLLQQAFSLYKTLVSASANPTFRQLYYFAVSQLPLTDERYFEKNWYVTNIQTPLRAFLLSQPLVEHEDGTNGKLEESWFPLRSYSKDSREKIWKFNYDLFSQAVCRKEDLHQWIDVIWDDIKRLSVNELMQDIAKTRNIGQLSEDLGLNEIRTFEWYNELGAFLISDEQNLPLFDKHAILPNENGNFLLKNQIYIDKIEDADLIEVLQLLGEDWNDILIHHSVDFGEYHFKEKKDIALKISEKLKKVDNTDHDTVRAISILSEWFDNHAEEGRELFAETYGRRAELFMNTIEDKESLYKVMKSATNLSQVAAAMENNPMLFENMEQAKNLFSLMKEYNVRTIEQLREVLEGQAVSAERSMLPITEEILVAMGITNVEEWEEAMRDTDLKALFDHRSVPSKEMYVLAHAHIDRARTRVIQYLETLSDDYNLDDLDIYTAPTVLAGVLKHGRPIKIVFRPAYSKEVIVYYGAEKDTLDYADTELWVDDGIEIWQVSLGYIIKKNNIKKFKI